MATPGQLEVRPGLDQGDRGVHVRDVDDAEPADDLLGLVERPVDHDRAVVAVLDGGRGLDAEQLGPGVGELVAVLLEPLVDLLVDRLAELRVDRGVEVGTAGEHEHVLHGGSLRRPRARIGPGQVFTTYGAGGAPESTGCDENIS